jgi:chemotaxis protein methyltransferase CheR
MNTNPAPAPNLDEKIYLRFHDLIKTRTGLVFSNGRRASLVQAILDNSQQESLLPAEYYARLKASCTDHESWGKLIRALTVSESYFFRDAAQIEALRRTILPELIRLRQATQTLRLWSAGCATGEEPYTLAILLTQLIPNLHDWNCMILATDINRAALEQAACGVYRSWSFRQTDLSTRSRYFTQQGDRFILSPAVRSMVTFDYLNLAEDQYPALKNNTQELDLILWRNVSIYLPTQTSQQIAERFYECLSPDGWLVVGASEANSATYHQFAMIRLNGAILYKKSNPIQSPPLFPGLEKANPFLHQAQEWDEREAVSHPGGKPLATVAEAPTGEVYQASAGKTPAELFEAGKKHLKMGHLEQAKALFQACLELEADYPGAFYQLAQLEANLGHLAEAENWARLATERDPLSSEAHYLLALISEEQGKLDQAMLELKRTIYLDSKFILAYFSLANLCQGFNQDKEAVRYRSRGMQLAQSQPEEAILPGSDDLTVKQLLNMHI